MASFVALPAVAAGTLLALSVPMFALKEVLEKRTKRNIKKHLGRRHACRLHFGEELETLQNQPCGIKNKKGEGKVSETDSYQSQPPAYNEVCNELSPPPYDRK